MATHIEMERCTEEMDLHSRALCTGSPTATKANKAILPLTFNLVLREEMQQSEYPRMQSQKEIV